MTGKLKLVEDGTRKATRLHESVAELDAQISRVNARVPLVQDLEGRLNGLSELSADIDRKLGDQLARRVELETLKAACDGLEAQMRDAQQKLHTVSELQTTLTPLVGEVTRLRADVGAAEKRLQAAAFNEAAISAKTSAVVQPEAVAPPHAIAPTPPTPAVVLSIARNAIRSDQPPPAVSDPTLSGLERLLRVSAARGASTLYLSSESRPSVRVDGELQELEGEPVHLPIDVESLLLALMPERSHEALRTGAATEWICDIEAVGRVRCMSFRDHRGPGGVFRLMPTRSVSADQLGLPRQVQALAMEPEGLVLVAGSRSTGKRTLMSAFVDLMNRTRRDHVITIEREINIVHERGNSFISQREVRGNDEDMLLAARAALREDPDVLVIDDLHTGALMNVALEAAGAGRLVIGGFSAHTATGTIDRIIDLYAPEHRPPVQFALADSLRGVIVQVLLHKIGGGRLPAREVLLNTPAVSSAIAEGKTSQLPMAIEGGRRHGMMPLNDALVGLVQTGVVEAQEAYRRSADRPGFLAALHRQGIDTSFMERLA
jgi:twitching motility protein PilT